MTQLNKISVSRPQSIEGARVQELLVFIGMPLDVVYRKNQNGPPIKSFWLRYSGQLHLILHDARQCWLQAIKKAHPDKRGSTKRAAALNAAWNRIQHLFANKGVRSR